MRLELERAKPTPICPKCGKSMRFARALPGIGGLAELWTFECRDCAEATEEKTTLLGAAVH